MFLLDTFIFQCPSAMFMSGQHIVKPGQLKLSVLQLKVILLTVIFSFSVCIKKQIWLN